MRARTGVGHGGRHVLGRDGRVLSEGRYWRDMGKSFTLYRAQWQCMGGIIMVNDTT